jgi:hypothetical protein
MYAKECDELMNGGRMTFSYMMGEVNELLVEVVKLMLKVLRKKSLM